MTLHIIKLCVGATSIEDLEQWQAERIAEQTAARRLPELVHVTRMFPKRRDAVLNGGSLFWVIEGRVKVRQPILELRQVECDDGITRCGIVYAPALIAVRPVPRRPFQGWRYLEPADAPPDLAGANGMAPEELAAMPAALQAELAELGLL